MDAVFSKVFWTGQRCAVRLKLVPPTGSWGLHSTKILNLRSHRRKTGSQQLFSPQDRLRASCLFDIYFNLFVLPWKKKTLFLGWSSQPTLSVVRIHANGHWQHRVLVTQNFTSQCSETSFWEQPSAFNHFPCTIQGLIVSAHTINETKVLVQNVLFHKTVQIEPSTGM